MFSRASNDISLKWGFDCLMHVQTTEKLASYNQIVYCVTLQHTHYRDCFSHCIVRNLSRLGWLELGRKAKLLFVHHRSFHKVSSNMSSLWSLPENSEIATLIGNKFTWLISNYERLQLKKSKEFLNWRICCN